MKDCIFETIKAKVSGLPINLRVLKFTNVHKSYQNAQIIKQHKKIINSESRLEIQVGNYGRDEWETRKRIREMNVKRETPEREKKGKKWFGKEGKKEKEKKAEKKKRVGRGAINMENKTRVETFGG